MCVRRLVSGVAALVLFFEFPSGGRINPLIAAGPPAGGCEVVYLGLGVSVGAYSLYGFSISRMPAARASMYMNLIPVFTLAFSMLILGERLAPAQCVASALVLGGVMISQHR